MKLLKLIVSGYTRFVPSQIKAIEIEFTAPVQIILGTNGSGKSSLMELLSPLPPSASMFEAGGYVQLECIHRGKHYVTISTFAKKADHKFLCDSENLNQSGNETEQKRLVKEHFGLTPQLFQILIAKTKFTTMKALDRRDFLMMLSGIDFDYIMSIFKQVKDHQRDVTGQYKGYLARENEELEKAKAIRPISLIDDDIKTSKAELATLNELMAHIPKGADKSDDLLRLGQSLNKLATDLNVLKPVKTQHIKEITTRDSALELAASTKSSIVHIRKQMNDLVSLKQKIDELAGLAITDKDSLQASIDALSELEAKRRATINRFNRWQLDDYEPLEAAATKGAQLLEEWTSWIIHYPDNTNLELNKDIYSERKAELQRNTESLANLRIKLELHKQTITRYDNAESIDCPNCQHSFKLHTNVAVYTSAKDALAKVIAEGKTLKHRNEELLSYVQSVEQYQDLRTRFYERLNQAPFTHGLIKRLRQLEEKGTNANMLTQLATTWLSELELVKEIVQIDKDIRMMSLSVERAKALLEQPQLDLHEPGQIEQEVNDCLSQIRQLEQTLYELDTYLTGYGNYTGAIDRYNTNLKQYKSLFQDSEHYLHRTYGALYQAHYQETLDTLDRELNGGQLIQAMIERFGELRLQSENTMKAGKRLLELLGPTEGLIAEYLYPFLQAFAGELNQFIRSIWTTDLTILPCALDKGEVDYKFPVQIGSDDQLRPDVADMSSAQKDVVNFAFRFLVVHILGLHDYPLYIDELDPSYDETHRVNAVNHVKNYVMSGSCSQLFMISHYVSNHSIFTHADYIVMNPQNLVHMPTVHNRNVTITPL